jgi:hypothetical protein
MKKLSATLLGVLILSAAVATAPRIAMTVRTAAA